MQEAQGILKGGRRGGGRGVRVHGRRWEGGGGGGLPWKIVVVCVLGLFGLVVLLALILRLRRRHFESRAEILRSTCAVLLLTVILLLPPVLFLALDDHLALGVTSVVVMCLLALPFFAWIAIAVRKSKRLREEPVKLKSVDASTPEDVVHPVVKQI